MGPQKLPIGVDEFDIAGGLAGVPIEVAQALTVDLRVPAQSEIVIEGQIDLEFLECLECLEFLEFLVFSF